MGPGREPRAYVPGGTCHHIRQGGWLQTHAETWPGYRGQWVAVVADSARRAGLPIPHPCLLTPPPGQSCSSSHRDPRCQPGGTGPVWSRPVLPNRTCLGRPPQGPPGTIFPMTCLLLLCLPCDFSSCHLLFCAGTQHTSLLCPWRERHPRAMSVTWRSPASVKASSPSLLGCGCSAPTWADLALLQAFVSCSSVPCGGRGLEPFQE